ncbi:thiol:disulfide interchange protein, partial [Phocaeicola dorei]
MKKKFFLSCLLIVMALLPAVAQIQDPVQFKTELKTISDTEAQIVFFSYIIYKWRYSLNDFTSRFMISS